MYDLQIKFELEYISKLNFKELVYPIKIEHDYIVYLFNNETQFEDFKESLIKESSNIIKYIKEIKESQIIHKIYTTTYKIIKKYILSLNENKLVYPYEIKYLYNTPFIFQFPYEFKQFKTLLYVDAIRELTEEQIALKNKQHNILNKM